MKRKHRKTHGIITFNELTKHISNAWRALPVHAKDVFSLLSFRDMQRCMLELPSHHV
jgi:hypothetical protein